MSVSVMLQIGIAVFFVLTVITLFLLLKFKKINKMITVFGCLILSLVCASGFLVSSLLEKPVFYVLGSSEMVIPVFSEFEDPGAVATYREKDVSDKINVKGNVDTKVLGTYNIEYDFDFKGQYYYGGRKITVVDNEKPEIKLKGNEKVKASSLELFEDPGFTAKDNYDGDIKSKVEVEMVKSDGENYRVIYSVTDSSGNKAEVYRDIIIKDTVKPTLKSDKGTSIKVAKGTKFTMPKVTAHDDLDGNITEKIEMKGDEVDTSKTGIYTLKYSVSDEAGNKKSLTVNVQVYVPDKSGKSVIYLTFDDGPSDNVTPRILNILKKNNIKATFFINGYKEDKLPIIKRAINEGHTIGIHGASHDYAKIYKSANACVNNINSLRDKLYKDTGYTATIMRFPGGSSNRVSMKYSKGVVTKSAKILTEQGWRYFDWNVDSGDADGKMSRNYIIRNTKQNLKKNRANTVLMHDYSTKMTTADALQSIIDYANENGFSFAPITDSTPENHHTIAN